MRPTPTRPSSTLRATMHTQKKRKNTSFRLQRELCSSLLPLSLFRSLYLFFSLSVSPVSSPPLTTAPVLSTRNPQAVHRQRGSPSVFLLLPFVEPISIIYILSFLSFFLSFLWQPVFTGSLPLLLKSSPFSYFSSSLT